MAVNESLRYGFDYDRRILMDVSVGAQTWLPIVNALLVHPVVLALVRRRKAMRADIRTGYALTVFGLLLSDWTLFGLRGHILSPFAGFYAEGPFSMPGRPPIAIVRGLIALAASCWLPAFTFLTVRMHQQLVLVLRGTKSAWLLTTRCQLLAFAGLFALQALNVHDFAVFALDADNATTTTTTTVRATPELAWMPDRGGLLFVLGDFGQLKQAKYEMVILGVTIASHAAILIVFHVHAIINLMECRKSLISNRTLRMTNQTLDVFTCQMNGVLLHAFAPLVVFFLTVVFDTRNVLPDIGHTALRFAVTMLFVTNPLRFSIVFVMRTSRHRKLFSRHMRDLVSWKRSIDSEWSTNILVRIASNNSPLPAAPTKSTTSQSQQHSKTLRVPNQCDIASQDEDFL